MEIKAKVSSIQQTVLINDHYCRKGTGLRILNEDYIKNRANILNIIKIYHLCVSVCMCTCTCTLTLVLYPRRPEVTRCPGLRFQVDRSHPLRAWGASGGVQEQPTSCPWGHLPGLTPEALYAVRREEQEGQWLLHKEPRQLSPPHDAVNAYSKFWPSLVLLYQLFS